MIRFVEVNRSEFMEACPRDVPYCYAPAWLDAYEKVFAYGIKYYQILNGRDAAGVFAFACIPSVLFGNRIVSMPLCDEGGAVLCDPSAVPPESKQALVRALAQLVEKEALRRHVTVVEMRGYNSLRQEQEEEGLFLRKKVYVRFVLDTRQGYDALQEHYHSNIHKNLRKARQHISVEEGVTNKDFPAVYKMYLLQMKQFGSPPLPAAYFRHLLDARVARIFLAKKAGAGIVGFLWVFIYNKRLYADINASLPRYNAFFPKVRLFDESIKWACGNGLEAYDFMRTRVGSGVYDHKKKWGGVEEPIDYYYLNRRKPRELLLDPEQKRFALPRWVLQRLPVRCLQWIGPRIRREAGK